MLHRKVGSIFNLSKIIMSDLWTPSALTHTALHWTVVYYTILYFTVLYCVRTLTREGDPGIKLKYQHEVEEVPEGRGCCPRKLPRSNAGIFCAPRFESRYKHYQIYKGDEILAVHKGKATYKALAISKPESCNYYAIF